jgi:diguanylate cyclase (GGDEF)-like protein
MLSNGAAPSILIVDDDPSIRNSLTAVLQDQGYTVHSASDGAKAFAMIKRNPPALVISDLTMPGGDGFQLVEKMRGRAVTADIPVILLSGIQEPERRIAGLDLGADDYVAKPIRTDELLARVRVHLRHARRQDLLLQESLMDPLTGTLNRRGILSVLHRERERAIKSGTHLSVLMLDLDGFKALNDSYGHKAGDMVLRHFAAAIAAAVRVVDHVGRLGGDEFVVVLPDGDPAEAAAVAARLAVLDIPPLDVADGRPLRVSASLGIATFRPRESVDDLLHRADAEMYRHKRNGNGNGNGVRQYSQK